MLHLTIASLKIVIQNRIIDMGKIYYLMLCLILAISLPAVAQDDEDETARGY